jgi:hypothetical protein
MPVAVDAYNVDAPAKTAKHRSWPASVFMAPRRDNHMAGPALRRRPPNFGLRLKLCSFGCSAAFQARLPTVEPPHGTNEAGAAVQSSPIRNAIFRYQENLQFLDRHRFVTIHFIGLLAKFHVLYVL